MLPNDDCYDVFVDGNDNVWVATIRGLGKYDGTNWTEYEEENGMPKENSRHVCVDSDNILYVGTYGGGVCILEDTTWTQYKTQDSNLASHTVWAVEIVEELKPQERDIIVQKFSHDPFFRPDLDRVLDRLVPDPTRYYAIVTGGAVNVCAYHTVMGFHLRNYWTVVPVDSVYYSSDADNQRALEQFSHPAYPNVFLSRSDLIEVSSVPLAAPSAPVPGS